MKMDLRTVATLVLLAAVANWAAASSSEEKLTPESLKKLLGQLEKIAAVDGYTREMPSDLIQSVTRHLEVSRYSHDFEYGRVDKSMAVPFRGDDIDKLMDLVGTLQIHEATPGLVLHLSSITSPITGPAEHDPREYHVAIRALVSFGEEGVPGVLAKMRSELKYSDGGPDRYWWYARFYFERLYGEDVARHVREITESEKDIPMRQRLVDELLPAVIRHMEFTISRQRFRESRY